MIGLIAKPHPMTVIDQSPVFLAALPASNMQNNDYGRVGKTNALAANGIVYVTLDLGAPMPVDVLGVLWHNMVAANQIQFQASSSWTSNANFDANIIYDSGFSGAQTGLTQRETMQFWKHVRTLQNTVTARYWKVIFKATTTALPAGLLASRVFIGRQAQFAIGPQKATLGAIDKNVSVTTEIGETRSQEDPTLIRPVAALSFSYAKQSEMETILGQYTLSLGTSRPMMVCTDLTSPFLQDNLVFGRPEQVVSHESDIYDVWSFEAVVPSIGP
jgi:hypothetical protein